MSATLFDDEEFGGAISSGEEPEYQENEPLEPIDNSTIPKFDFPESDSIDVARATPVGSSASKMKPPPQNQQRH